MKRSYMVLAFIGLLVLLSFPSSIAAQDTNTPAQVGLRPDAPTYALHGPYWVGTHEFVIDADSDHPLPVTAWYPALNPDGLQEVTTYSIMPGNSDMTVAGHALLDASSDISNAPYPLIILSHGTGGTRLMAPYYAEHLASYGFVVLAPDHFGDVMTADLQSDVYRLYHRPLDISHVIDAAAEQTTTAGFLKGMIDVDHIGVTGISAGGYTSLMAGGAAINLSSLKSFCQDYPEDDRCPNILDRASELATLAGLSTVPEGNWPAWGDARVDAIVPIVPGPGVIGEGAKTVSVPTLLLLASADTIAIPEYNGYPIWENLGSPTKALVEFMNAGHPFALFKCSDAPWFGQVAYPFCSDSVWDSDRIHDLLNHFSTAFLLDVLKGDKDAAAAFAPDAVSFPGIRYEAKGF